LHVAGINPFKRSDQLTREEVERFLAAMRKVLKLAIQKRGTTVFDYRGARNDEGGFQHYLQVYQRPGKPCRTCGATILRATQSQRGTFFCPACQGVPPAEAARISRAHSQRGRGRRPAAGRTATR
ncbi:MAG TPA: zinc finger domain-containing protein, partial [bacterium]|nr:zinc finger domain-containing protein [bacterium]